MLQFGEIVAPRVVGGRGEILEVVLRVESDAFVVLQDYCKDLDEAIRLLQ